MKKLALHSIYNLSNNSFHG